MRQRGHSAPWHSSAGHAGVLSAFSPQAEDLGPFSRQPLFLSGAPFLPSGLRIQDVAVGPLRGEPRGSYCSGKRGAKEDGRPGRNGGLLGGLTTDTGTGGGSRGD